MRWNNNATRRRWPLKHKSRNTNKMYRRCRKETKSKRHFIPRRRCYPRYLKGTVILCNVYSLKLKTISVLIRVRNFCIGHPISGQLLFGWCLNELSRYLSASVCANSVRTVICLLRRSCANRKTFITRRWRCLIVVLPFPLVYQRSGPHRTELKPPASVGWREKRRGFSSGLNFETLQASSSSQG